MKSVQFQILLLLTEQPALRAYSAGSSGTRGKGRPRKQWIFDMKALFKNSMGLDMFEATQLAKKQTVVSPRNTHHEYKAVVDLIAVCQ